MRSRMVVYAANSHGQVGLEQHEQGLQEGTEYTALRCSWAQGQCRGGEVTYSDHRGSACQEVQDPFPRRGV